MEAEPLELLAFDMGRFPPGYPVQIPAFPAEASYAFACVIAMHGLMEREFHIFYEACCSACPEEKDKHAGRIGLRKKATACLRKCAILFADSPPVKSFFDELCALTKATENRRNAVLHGAPITIFLKDNGGRIFASHALVGGVETEVVYQTADIEQLGYDMGGVANRLLQLFDPPLFHRACPPLSFEETQIARDRLVPHYRRPANPPTRPRLPLASLA